MDEEGGWTAAALVEGEGIWSYVGYNIGGSHLRGRGYAGDEMLSLRNAGDGLYGWWGGVSGGYGRMRMGIKIPHRGEQTFPGDVETRAAIYIHV